MERACNRKGTLERINITRNFNGALDRICLKKWFNAQFQFRHWRSITTNSPDPMSSSNATNSWSVLNSSFSSASLPSFVRIEGWSKLIHFNSHALTEGADAGGGRRILEMVVIGLSSIPSPNRRSVTKYQGWWGTTETVAIRSQGCVV